MYRVCIPAARESQDSWGLSGEQEDAPAENAGVTPAEDRISAPPFTRIQGIGVRGREYILTSAANC